ncbi:hypothetical protein [Chondromyces apiculatus]|nr:hypothetical protein [Chondromyces apiculatus]
MNPALSRLAQLALVWVLSRPRGEGRVGDLRRGLQSTCKHLGSWKDQLDDAMLTLERAGLVICEGRTLRLTEAGRRQGLAALGVEALPARASWKTLRQDYLVPRLLGASPRRTLKRGGKPATTPGEALVGAILARHEGLALGESPSGAATQNALAWRALGVESTKPFNREAVLSLTLTHLLRLTRPVEAKQGMQMLAAKHVGARRGGVDELRGAVVRQWLAGRDAEEAAVAPISRSGETEGLSEFARQVLAAARASRSGRFGDNKVFIAHVYRELDPPGLDLEAFKVRLVEAKRAGLLSLSRADLVEAMAPEDVRHSEASDHGARFHFVRLEEQRAQW